VLAGDLKRIAEFTSGLECHFDCNCVRIAIARTSRSIGQKADWEFYFRAITYVRKRTLGVSSVCPFYSLAGGVAQGNRQPAQRRGHAHPGAGGSARLDVAFIDAKRQSYDFERIEEMARAAPASTPNC